ncbi:uncharacterized protein Kcp_3 isoform X1 [Zeugodacus cucurbitae]|uniref:Kielin/chordin-like protein n=1 Tax=Zeugodacus cucurbitae TaxID=28588 RepID=A0A0A1WZA2_ZEUCU|nr:uncharacterized protein Kcp_3 isoform X1 [Zeugodacus cucurbitae]XP_054082443.1 uncharacterized protein Kcp_3 isoform X1 [Zeugodacus cucurbitae]
MCNSRRHSRLWFNSLAILICLLCSGLVCTNAAMQYYHILPMGNVDDGSALLRLTRELSAKLIQERPKEISSTAEPVPAVVDQPQGQCLLDGVLVMETAVTCEKQVGCRAIQKTGHCCPDYKCDCQKDGRTYLNGDKLVDPETPCTVCYCQGGEILCSSVTCFHRDDCKPKYIPGRCCPEYDNCPVSILDPSHNGNQSHNPSPTTKETNAAIASSNQPIQQTVPQNPKITIKEITKPIEIRITDDNKAIPIHQIFKPQTTTTTQIIATESTTTSTAITDGSGSTQLPASAPTSSVATISPNTPITATDVGDSINGESTSTVTVTGSNINSDNNSNFGVDNNRQIILPVKGGINNGESLKLSASVAYPSTERNTVKIVIPQNGSSAESSNNDSGEVTAVVAQLNEGDISIPEFGAQELQHDASFDDPTKINIKRENLATTERSLSVVPIEEYGSPELLDGNGSGQSGGLQSQSSFDFEPETAGSDNVYHIILTTSGPPIDGSTDGFVSFKPNEDFQLPSDFEIQAAASNPQHAVVPPPPHLANFTDSPITLKSTTQAPATELSPTLNNTLPSTEGILLASISTESPKHTSENSHHVEEEETALPVESNPAYPSLPEDDFSLRDVNFPINEADEAVETDVKEEQRSIGGNALEVVRPRKPLEEGSGGGVEFMEASSTATYEACVDCTTENLSKLSDKVALLMNSAEDLSAETSISNNTDFISERFSRLANNTTNSDSNESIEMQLSSELGSGESTEVEKKLEKRREPTTPRPTPRSQMAIDIDELSGSASGDGKSDPKDDPKLDAESIKADENVEEGIVKQEAGLKEDVLTVNAKPTEERTAEEIPPDSPAGRIQQLLQRRFV